jgi:nicotinamide mononucleotide transporter
MLDTVFTLWGAPVTVLEILAFALSLACIICNVFEIHWGWPLAVVSSALYAWFFSVGKLYGEAAVNVFFALSAVWGWWQWVYGKRSAVALKVEVFPRRFWPAAIAAWLLGWLAIGAFLKVATDSNVPFFDAFPTMGSIIGTVLLARKFVANWPVWVLVNAVSVALFTYKQFYLTAVLYVIFFGMALWGWRRWHALTAAA